MRIMCTFAHPKASSYNGAILAQVVEDLTSKGHEIEVWDLYKLGFNPVLPLSEIQRGFSLDSLVQKAYEAVIKADAYIFIHPVWWGGQPAILKGFLDRVYCSGVSFEFVKNCQGNLEKRIPLSGRKALVFMTTDYPEESVSSHERVWKEGLGDFCGLKFSFKVLWNLFLSSYDKRKEFLDSISITLDKVLLKED